MEQKIEPALFPVRELEEREFEPATRFIFTKVQLDGPAYSGSILYY